MSKLYVFAIGGTGTRVLRSLAMLMAAGMPSDIEEIVPMIIDTDVNNGDLERLRSVLNDYEEIHNSGYKDITSGSLRNHFFRTRISKPNQISIDGSSFGTLADMVNYDSLNASGHRESKLMIDMLFSEDVLKMKLDKGFMGSPNVGSIVLKHVINSQGFKDFTQGIRPGDRIFIINSIFGGTGAAGFPMLLKLFRDSKSPINNIGYINNCIIGAVTVLPYFEVDVTKFESGDSAINSDTFITKTKAALSYYDRHVGQLINALFYIGDTKKSKYENFDGGESQKNPSNFIELASALAILDFMNYQKQALEVKDLDLPTRYFEFGIDQDTTPVNFNHLRQGGGELFRQLTAFKYASVYLSNYLRSSLENKNLAWKNELKIKENYEKSAFVKSLRNFCNMHFFNYLRELALEKHGRRFSPFNLYLDTSKELDSPQTLNITPDSLFNIVSEVAPKRSRRSWGKDSIKFNQMLSDQAFEVSQQNHSSVEAAFLDMLSKAMNQIFNERYQH